MQELLDLSVELSQDNKQVGVASTVVTFDRIPGVDPQLQLSTDWQLPLMLTVSMPQTVGKEPLQRNPSSGMNFQHR